MLLNLGHAPCGLTELTLNTYLLSRKGLSSPPSIMSISAASITARLAYFQSLVSKWESRQPAPLPFPSSADTLKGGSEREGKDVVVALRTRPSLDSEAKRFQPDDAETAAIQPSGEDGVASPSSSFCTGITVRSAEPGVMVAHVPGMKVICDETRPPLLLLTVSSSGMDPRSCAREINIF